MVDIDTLAKSDVINKCAMPESLHLPIAAKDKESIARYVGDIVAELSAPNTNNAFLVEVPKPTSINTKLAVWKLPESKVFHQVFQVWVHVDYTVNGHKLNIPKDHSPDTGKGYPAFCGTFKSSN